MMRPYGKKKANRKGESHGDYCGICRPPTKNKKANARREGKHKIIKALEEIVANDCDCPLELTGMRHLEDCKKFDF